MWLYHKGINLEWKKLKEVFTVEEVVQLLKEGYGIFPSDEVDHTTSGISGKQLLGIKLVLKENNVE